MRGLLLLATHAGALAVGFAAGIYVLPILTAAPPPDAAMVEAAEAEAVAVGTFRRDLRGSDRLHWGEGTIAVTATQAVHRGALAPGPDYRLYLTRGLVEHEDGFAAAQKVMIGPVDGFEGFALALPPGVDPAEWDAALIWCEAFGEFITAAVLEPR